MAIYLREEEELYKGFCIPWWNSDHVSSMMDILLYHLHGYSVFRYSPQYLAKYPRKNLSVTENTDI